MNKFLWTCVALVASIATVGALLCHTCDVEILGRCLLESPVNCSSSQTSCYTAEAKFTSTELLTIHAKGCTEADSCNNEVGTILTVGYTINRTCCTTDNCNGAASTQVHLLAALGTALVSIWITWWH
ncbi:prostate stem cell antigen-like [Myripristis murdjan]|uniref:prostate stem cell antigen-like n=1 Tax=Myripristis murdjan TaxID=586833 RepID=UPI0011760C22|nr:prostate stem cell antigen-like [Myripristis murdjan]